MYSVTLLKNQYFFPPQEILVVYPSTDVEHSDEASMFEAPPNYVPMPTPKPSSSAPDYSRALKWKNLRHANFKLNQLTVIDDSLVRILNFYFCVHQTFSLN